MKTGRHGKLLLYWLAFVAWQSLGFLLPSVANVHSNIAPLIVGLLLLVPGSLFFYFGIGPDIHLSYAFQGFLVVTINALCWWAIGRFALFIAQHQKPDAP